mgnify:CR=1 FL=1|jgi:hypothetical protein
MAKKKAEEKEVAAVKAAPKAAAKKAAPKKAVAKKAPEAKAELVINAETVGFRAGDVYQTIATAQKSLSVKEIAKLAKISEEEVFLGAGWLLKEGKITDDGGKFAIA